MGNAELRRTTEAQLMPWQREIGIAYSSLMRAQAELSMLDAGAEEMEEKRMGVARRTGNLAKVLDAHRDNVDRVPDSFDITPQGESGGICYYTKTNEVKRVTLGRWTRRPNHETAEPIEALDWAGDVRITSAIRLHLMDLIPPVNKEVIIAAVAVVPEHVEL